MQFTGVKPSEALGLPDYVREKDSVEFYLGTGMDMENGAVFRAVPMFDQWQIANVVYKRGGSLIVSDFRGKGQYRTWRVTPTESPARGVILEPLHDDGTFFRGGKAYVTEPLVLVPAMKAIVAYIGETTMFNRVSASLATGKGFGDCSRHMALFHNYGVIRATGNATRYEETDLDVVNLKSDKDRELAVGNKMCYEKTDTWPAFKAQYDRAMASKEKATELEFPLALVAADQEAGLTDDDLVPGEDDAGDLPPPVDQGPVGAAEVLDQ